jgi:flagellar basal-body rod protein FlgB
MSFLDITQQALEAAMSGSMQRQTLLTGILANADTPGYQPQDVNFQQTLASALQQGQPLGQLSFQPYTAPQVEGPDGNGVDADQTNAEIAENGMLYQELTDVAAARDQMYQTAISTTGP